TACGPNRLGRSCEYRCNASLDDETACRGVQICLPDPYGCSCATGYTDLNCTTECDVGKFGASCSETCHCVSGECDRFTGVCTGSLTDCQPRWTGTNCQQCTEGRFGQNCSGTIEIENIAKNEGQPDIGFTCRRDGEEDEYLSSAQPVVRLHRVTDAQGRLSDEGITRIGDLQQDSTTIDFFQVDQVAADDLFVCIIYDVDNYRSDAVRADVNILPQLRGQLSIVEATQTSITLSWIEWKAGVDIGDPPVIGYNVYYKEAVSSTWIRVDRRNPLDVSEFIDGLDPDSDYLFAVSVVREGDGGEGPLTSFSASTACLPPSGVVSYVRAHQVSSPDELLITWQSPISSAARANCRSGFTNISIYFSSMSDVSTQGQVQIPFNDTTGSYYLDSLESETQYSVYITLWNKDSEGPPSEASSVTTYQTGASGSPVPWALFAITFFVAVVITIAFVFLWRRSCKTNSDPEPPKASRTKSVKEESTYENPVFDEPPVNQYESLDAITTNDDYMIPDAP
ncbi:angiopoietin-1 receptor-like, partial [Lytechinus pictus]|uniref:angiopoietin-1 receptor-like n=1 Tax=Lytechinus pictus TaxID=7653 RepID=UPI0030BA1C29